MLIYEKIVEILKTKNLTLSTMESCTGGSLASEITNHSGSSEVFYFGAVTYSNEYKIKMGVDENIINKYSVYSKNTAEEMALKITNFTNSNYGIGITGKINNPDFNNLSGKDNEVFIAIYDKINNKFYNYSWTTLDNLTRKENKESLILFIGERFYEIIK